MVHALRSDAIPDRTLAVVETRALGADIVTGIEFHLQRCVQTGVSIFAITDGQILASLPDRGGCHSGETSRDVQLVQRGRI